MWCILFQRATLAQLDCTDDAEKLSTRQLKEILAGNYVNYKGCCEKWELIERVKRLWRQNQLEENAGGPIIPYTAKHDYRHFQYVLYIYIN